MASLFSMFSIFAFIPLLLFTSLVLGAPSPMLKTPEEQQDKGMAMPAAQFWSFLVHPSTGGDRAEQEQEKTSNKEKKTNKKVEINTSEQGRRSEPIGDDEPTDYYDAIRAEEEEAAKIAAEAERESEREEQKMAKKEGGKSSPNGGNKTAEEEEEEEKKVASDVVEMMAALRVNVDPASSLLQVDGQTNGQDEDGEGETGGKGRTEEVKKSNKASAKGMKPIVFPVAPPKVANGTNRELMVRLDGDTYDDERAAMGRADEEDEEGEEAGQMADMNVKGEERNGTGASGKEEEEKEGGAAETILELLPEGKQFDEAELGRAAQVDGETSNGMGKDVKEKDEEGEEEDEYPMMVDGETGEQAMEKQGKTQGGGAGRLPEPPKAKIFGIA